MLLKTNEPGIFRDSSSSTLINTDAAAYKAYKQQRNSTRTIETLNTELDNMRSEVDELKNLVKELLKEKNG